MSPAAQLHRNLLRNMDFAMRISFLRLSVHFVSKQLATVGSKVTDVQKIYTEREEEEGNLEKCLRVQTILSFSRGCVCIV